MYKIKVGAWREDTTGPMQVVSGALGKEKVHFQAPSSELVDSEMNEFINWFEEEKEMDLILKAGIAHLWFVTVHPFEDGNGRIARAITDLVLTRSENNSYRFYSMSLQIRKARRDYYEILEKTQKGSLEITNWLIWFLQSLKEAISSSDEIVEGIVKKHIFWTKHAGEIFNERQIKLLNRLFNGFEGKLTTSKWAKIAKTSKDSALRDIQNLIERNILEKEKAGGRSTNYRLVE